MSDEKIERINFLARKSRSEGLTDAEKDEQTALRNEYRSSVKRSLGAELDNTYIVSPDGTKRKVGRHE